jgi:acyl-CoA thioesterase-1
MPAVSAAPSRPTEILAFGDSLTAGFGLPREKAFPARLEAWLKERGVPAHVINAGISGETTAGGRSRLDASLTSKPDLVILELGANDALRGVDPAVVRANLGEMIEKIQRSGAKLLLTGILAPPNWGEEYRRAFDRVFPELARTYRIPIYAFFLEGVANDPQLNQPDGLHPNERGVAKLVERIGPIVVRLMRAQP